MKAIKKHRRRTSRTIRSLTATFTMDDYLSGPLSKSVQARRQLPSFRSKLCDQPHQFCKVRFRLFWPRVAITTGPPFNVPLTPRVTTITTSTRPKTIVTPNNTASTKQVDAVSSPVDRCLQVCTIFKKTGFSPRKRFFLKATLVSSPIFHFNFRFNYVFRDAAQHVEARNSREKETRTRARLARDPTGCFSFKEFRGTIVGAKQRQVKTWRNNGNDEIVRLEQLSGGGGHDRALRKRGDRSGKWTNHVPSLPPSRNQGSPFAPSARLSSHDSLQRRSAQHLPLSLSLPTCAFYLFLPRQNPLLLSKRFLFFSVREEVMQKEVSTRRKAAMFTNTSWRNDRKVLYLAAFFRIKCTSDLRIESISYGCNLVITRQRVHFHPRWKTRFH